MENVAHADEAEAIRTLVSNAEALQSDVDGFIELHRPDAAIVNIAGRRVPNRDEIYQAMKEALASPLADVLTRNEIEDLRFLRPDVALVSCIKHVSDQRDASGGGPALPLRGRLTYVVVKEDGAWQIALAQTTPIKN